MMNNNIYQIAIKKEYATSVINNLKLMDAIKILAYPIPEWQQQESLQRLASYEANPTVGIDDESFFKAIEKEDE